MFATVIALRILQLYAKAECHSEFVQKLVADLNELMENYVSLPVQRLHSDTASSEQAAFILGQVQTIVNILLDCFAGNSHYETLYVNADEKEE